MAQQKVLSTSSFVILTLLLWSSVYASPKSEVVFEKSKIQLGSQVLDVDVAKTMKQKERGLMFVKQIPENYGMLFVYEGEDHRGFWMKNTLIPLSIGFFDKNKKLVEIVEMKPVKSFLDKKIDSIVSQKRAQYALEVNRGWFEKNKIGIGTTFKWINTELTQKKNHKNKIK